MSAPFWQCTICTLLNSSCNNKCNSCLSEKSFNPFITAGVNQEKYNNINSWASMVEMIKRENSKCWKYAKPYIDLLFNKIHFLNDAIESVQCDEENNNINYNDENKCIHLLDRLKKLMDLNEEYYNQFRHDLIMENATKINILLDLLSINSNKLQHIRYSCNDCNELKCYLCRRKMIKINDNLTQNKFENNQYLSNIKINARINMLMKNNKIFDIKSSSFYSGQPNYYNINVKTGKLFIVTVVNQNLLNFVIYDMNQHEIEFEKNSCDISDTDNYKYRDLEHIDIIPDYNHYHSFNDNESIIIKIINYWQRIGSFVDVFIPNDLYCMIHQFYSLYNKNIVHIIFYFSPWCSEEYKIDHTIIDINENRRCHEEYFKPQLLSTIRIKKEKRSCYSSYKSWPKQFFPICRNGKFKLISIFSNKMVSINLENGSIQIVTKNMHEFDKYHKHFFMPYIFNKCFYHKTWELIYTDWHKRKEDYFYHYNIIDICNPLKQYIFLSRFSKYTQDLEIFIFDKLEMEMIPIYLELGAQRVLQDNKLFYDGTFLCWNDQNHSFESIISKIKVEVNKNQIKCI